MKCYMRLENGINWRNSEYVSSILDQNKKIDLLYDNGIFFRRSIENNDLNIVTLLLEYFEENQLGKYAEGSTKYLSLKSQLQYIITDIAEDNDLSSNIKELSQPYLLNQVSTTDNSDEKLDGYKDPMDVFEPHKHFSNNSTQDCYPEEHLSVSGSHEDFNDES